MRGLRACRGIQELGGGLWKGIREQRILQMMRSEWVSERIKGAGNTRGVFSVEKRERKGQFAKRKREREKEKEKEYLDCKRVMRVVMCEALRRNSFARSVMRVTAG